MSTSRGMTKCVILARGLGRRMRRDGASTALTAAQSVAADAGLKAMVPVGRPFLDYVLSGLADAGFQHACVVIGPEHHIVREYYTREVRLQRIEVSFAVQVEPRGTADALLATAGFAGADEFLVINGDNYYPPQALSMVQGLGHPGTVLFAAETLVRESNIPQERLRAFAYCIVDREGYLVDIVEKPAPVLRAAEERSGKLISMNLWRFPRDIFAACLDVNLSPRGEYELPEAVKLAMHRGVQFKTKVCHAGVLDLSQRSDIAQVTARLQNIEVRL